MDIKVVSSFPFPSEKKQKKKKRRKSTEKKQGRALFSSSEVRKNSEERSTRIVKRIAFPAIAVIALVVIGCAVPSAVTGGSATPTPGIPLIALSALPSGLPSLTPPGSTSADAMPRMITAAKQIIRARLGTGQSADIAWQQLDQAFNRMHNQFLRTVNGKAQMPGSAALKALYEILYKMASRKLFFLVVPINECELMQLQGEIPITCMPQE